MVPSSNIAVTKDYVSVINKALNRAGICTNTINYISLHHDNDDIIVITHIDAIKARLFGYKKIILWSQGLIAEESYMRHKSKIRYIVLQKIEELALDYSKLILFVSNEMKNYYEKKYNKTYSNCYIMPCFNEELDQHSFDNDYKYNNNIFVYVGNLAKWQCFEETVQIFMEIEKRITNCFFKVLTKDVEKAERIINFYGINNYSVDYVPKERVGEEIKNAKFGFCLRQDSPVNNVATPTKLSSYISQGIMPIYTSNIKDFYSISADSPFCFCYDFDHKEESIINICEICKTSINARDVRNDYINRFGKYYSKAHHCEELTKVIQNIGI